jgi:hypothetical protein
LNAPLLKIDWRQIDFTKPSVVSLIAANVIPLLGVLLLGWSTFAIVVIYWAENVIIGAINVLKMLTCAPSPESLKYGGLTPEQLKGNSAEVMKLLEKQSESPLAHQFSKLFLIPFFTFHYGMFCFVHGVFVFALLGHDDGAGFGGPFTFAPHVIDRLRQDHLLWAVLALAASHLFSFFTNYIQGGEYRRVLLPQLMFQPYGRIIVLHVAILLGAFLLMAVGSPVFLLIMLIAGKTLLDIGLHLAERAKNS